MKIAFDINGTLIREDANETFATIEFLKILKKAGHYIIVWSGDDLEEIEAFIKDFDLQNFVDLATSKMDLKVIPDVAFDDNENMISQKITIKV